MTSKDVQVIVGLNLKKLIKKYYLTQEEFAYEFGADIRTINRYVNNGINKISTIQELADFFDVDFTDFFKE